jgi:outer membrane protein insertion porin family
MKKVAHVFLLFFTLTPFISPVLSTVLSTPLHAETIEKIIIEGNKKVSRDTMLFYMKSRDKGPFSKKMLRDDFKTLWDTGFFENIAIEAQDGVSGKIVRLNVAENFLISSVKFKTGKKIKENDIIEKLQDNKIVLTAFSYFNPSRLKRVEKIILDLLQDKGFNQGKVNISTTEDTEKRQVNVVIDVVQGPKTRIAEVIFPGLDSKKISPGFLKRGMKNSRRHDIFSSVGGKDVFNKEKIGEDLEEVRLRLQQKGFLEARVGTPKVSMIKGKTIFGKSRPMMRIAIPIETGPQYRVGSVKIEGNKVIKTEFLYSLITLKKGDLYNIKKRNTIVTTIKDIYGNFGHIFCSISPIENLDPVKRIADVTFRINEGDIAYVGKLEFKGNTFTRDNVIRREWLIQEGRRMNMGALKNGLTRMQQLGIVSVEEAPEFEQDPVDPQKLNISVNVKELNRQMVNFNFGFSGYQGTFIALGYSTQNFLGRGETMNLNLQYGSKYKQYRLAFSEPYLLGLPVNTGFSIHKTDIEYTGMYLRKGQGFSLSTSGRIYHFLRGSLSYSYEKVNIEDITGDSSSYNPLDSIYHWNGTTSSISPTIYYSTVDSPLFPTRGSKILFSYKYSGGFLGGDVNLHKTKLQLQTFIRPWEKSLHTLGLQLIHQSLTPFGKGSFPLYEKFYMGGESSIRGFDYYQVGPRNAKGNAVGGNKSLQLNFEYTIPFNRSRQVSASLFYDIGNVYDFGKSINFKDIYSSMGLEFKVYVPMLNVPFRLIFAYNPRVLEPNDSHFAFRFAVGTSFQ